MCSRGLFRNLVEMPKASVSSLPVSGLFGVAKPSGPTSMSIVTRLQELLARSRLFVEGSKLDELGEKKIQGRKLRQLIKVGQGGTLDPLADGVLGEDIIHFKLQILFGWY
jgi:tRNA pseudouridine55 synthase